MKLPINLKTLLMLILIAVAIAVLIAMVYLPQKP
jgi:hypothetical protein